MSLNYLPGINVNTVDGGLASTQAPKAHSVLIIGTSAQGVINQPYQVTDRAKAALEFGLAGNLVRSMEEAAANSDNIILFRMGAKPQVLAGIGVETGTSATAGFSLSFGQASATANTDYTLWYKAGVVAVYYQGSLVFTNDPAAPVDTGDITVTGSIAGNTGLQIGTGTAYSATAAITVQAASVLAGATATPAPTLTAAVTGVGLTGRQSFIAYLEAADLLEGYQAEELVVPAATLDAPNVAFYVSTDATTAANNPAVNADALDWLQVSVDAYGNSTYHWASELVDSTGAVAAAYVPTSAAQRLTGGYYEANWGYALANFAAQVSSLNQTCIAFIGTSAPPTYKLVDVRKWVGFLPKFDVNGNVTAAGAGLLGNPYLLGTNVSKLNTFTFDYSTGYRQPGFFQTASGQYDDVAQLDRNSNPIDIGAYLHVVADQAILSNGYANNYVANLATWVAGFCSVLDQKNALTNKAQAVKQLPGLVYTSGQLDALTQAKINVLRNKGLYASPAMLHDFTAATDASDYTELLRVRIKGLVISTMLAIGDPFIGSSSLDGLQLTSLKTALDNGLVELQKRGYISNPQVTISTTNAEAKIGHADLFLTFHAADELVQLNAYVGLSQ
jgi:hypothetical protein